MGILTPFQNLKFYKYSMQKVTLKIVAKAAGVSEMTASRALRGHRDVSDKTRELVTETAAQLGYIPNRAASMLASKSSKIIPMIVPSLRNTVFLETISSAQEVISENGYHMMLFNTDYSLEKEAEAVAQILAWSPAALILPGVNHSETTLNLLKEADFPIIEVMDIADTAIDICVGFSHTKVGREMGNYLLSKGYRSFGFACSMLHRDIRGKKRYEGFKSAIVEAGLPDPKIIDIEQRVPDMVDTELLEKFAEQCRSFDCIYFHNDTLASAMLLTLNRLGIKVPEDIAIAGFNNLITGRLTSPRLTTTHSPRRKIGKIAAETALKIINGQKLELKKIDLGCKLIEGKST